MKDDKCREKRVRDYRREVEEKGKRLKECGREKEGEIDK